MAASCLSRLVGDTDSFLGEVFGRVPLHAPASRADAFDDVLSLLHVDELVSSTALRAPSFRLVKNGATLPTSQVTRRARIGSRPVDDLIDVVAVHTAFEDGASIVLQGLHRSWEPVARLCRALEKELTHPVQANAYLTPPVAQGLDVHEDPHDVFAVQTHGVKRWVVHPPDGSPEWDIELRAGDVLYLPAGTRHAAQTIELPSLHLTIGVRAVGWAAATRRVLDEVLAHDESRDPLPAGWAEDPDAHSAALANRLEALAASLRDDAATAARVGLRSLAAGFWSARVPDRRGGLLDLLELDELDDTTPLRTRADVSLRQESDGDGFLIIVLADRRIRLPDSLEAVLERLLNSPRFVPRDLDELIDEPSRLVFCRRLIREGVLSFDRAPHGGVA